MSVAPRGGYTPDQLRFGIGQRVICNIGKWARGTIVALNYTEPHWPRGKVSPYQVLLDKEETLIHVPFDRPQLCRVEPPPSGDKAERFKVSDHVMFRIGTGQRGRWLPGKVVELDIEGGDVNCSLNPYGIQIDPKVPPPFGSKMVEAGADHPDVIRAETCFSTNMAHFAAVHPVDPNAPAKLAFPKKMRFEVGAQVACRVDSKRDGSGQKCSWQSGTVSYVRSPFGPDRGAAYKIELDNGEEVYASRDEHWLVRPLEHQKPSDCAEGESCPNRFEQLRRGDEVIKFDHVTTRAIPWDPDDDDDSD